MNIKWNLIINYNDLNLEPEPELLHFRLTTPFSSQETWIILS